MKKLNVLLMALAITLAFGVSAFAYQSTLSPSGERLQSRNAAAGTIDAAYYNPAGLTQLADGIYVDLGYRVLYLTKETEGLGATFESKTWTPAIPNIALAYKTGKGSMFYTLTVQDGGAGGLWEADSGAMVLNSQFIPAAQQAVLVPATDEFEMSEFVLGHTIGGAYQLNDMISVGAGFRVLQQLQRVTQTFNTNASTVTEIETKVANWGYTPLIGIMATPMAGLNVSLQYQAGLWLDGTEIQKIKSAASTTDKDNSDGEYKPAYLAFGVGYKVMDGLDVSCSYTYEFSGERKQDNVVLSNENSLDTHRASIGAQYQLIPMLALSFGCQFQSASEKRENNIKIYNADFNQLNVGAGVVITPMENLNIEVVVSDVLYFKSKGPGAMEHSQNALIMGIGANYKI